MKAFVSVLGLLALLSGCSPQVTLNLNSETDSAIINGDPVSNSDDVVKSVASIQSVSGSDTVHRCTAVFIQRRVLLTSAHCFYDYVNGQFIPRETSRMALALGVNVQSPSRLYKIKAVRSHPSYDPKGSLCKRGEYTDTPPAFCDVFDKSKNQSADIGMVFLAEDPPAGVKPVAPYMAEMGEAFSGLAAGYGYSQSAREMKTPEARRRAIGVLSVVRTPVSFNIVFGEWPEGLKFTNDTLGVQFDNLWNGPKGKHVFTQGGDSGSPIFAIDASKQLRVVGILTGAGNKVQGQAVPMNYMYNIYIRVKPNLRWVTSQLSSGI